MKSYALAVVVSMLFAAIYAIQNTTGITVRFLTFEGEFSQGLWEVLVFASGGVLMWLFSIFASLELRSKHRAQIKERDKKITTLEEEKSSLLIAFKNMPPASDVTTSIPAGNPAFPASETDAEANEKEIISV